MVHCYKYTHTFYTNISVEMWMGQSIKTVLSFLPPVPVSRCVVYLASVSVLGRTLDLSPRENLIVDVTFRLWQVLGNQWPVAGQVDNAPRHQTDTKGFLFSSCCSFENDLNTLILTHFWVVNNSPLNTHDETIYSRWPRGPIPGSQSLHYCSDWCRHWCQSFYLSYNIQIFNFSQLERISLLNCWERGELSLTLDQVPRAPPDCGRYWMF